MKDLRLKLHELSAGLHDSMPGEKTASKQSTIPKYSECKATGNFIIYYFSLYGICENPRLLKFVCARA